MDRVSTRRPTVRPQRNRSLFVTLRTSPRWLTTPQALADLQLAYRLRMQKMSLRWMVLASALLVGCASPGLRPLQVGASEAEVRQLWGEPTGRHALPTGSRLEYATGPYGVTTWMVDLDAAGRASSWKQVLAYPNLRALQDQLPGMRTEELLRTLGRPGTRRDGGRQDGETWTWRIDSTTCMRFNVAIDANAVVRSSSFSSDPWCGVGRS